MTYNLFLIGKLDRPRLAAALAALASVPPNDVDVSDADDYDHRNWDAAVSCTCERVTGDVTWMLDIYLTETVTSQPTEPQAAAFLAQRLGTALLYPAAEPPPSAYWLVAPGGLRTRARLYAQDEDDHTAYTIDAVARPVPMLPSVAVTPIPEVIREHRMPTPVTNRLKAWMATAAEVSPTGEDLRFASDRLAAWESLTVRMTSGWPPDGWYPADYYREDLQIRDELETAVERLPPSMATEFKAALAHIDDAFRKATTEADSARLFSVLRTSRIDPAMYNWWWRRLPDPPCGHPGAGRPGRARADAGRRGHHVRPR